MKAFRGSCFEKSDYLLGNPPSAIASSTVAQRQTPTFQLDPLVAIELLL